jgi:hypothetical protein
MLETKIVESYYRKSRSRLPEENKQPPGDGSRNGEASQATQRRQGDLDCAGQPAGRRLRESDAGCVLNLKRKLNSFQRNFPTRHPLIFFLRLGEGCIL